MKQDDPVMSLPESAQKVYAIIKANEGISRPGIVKKAGLSDSTVKRCVALLIRNGKIAHRDSDKTGGYYAK